MTTLNLPEPIAAYFDADKRGDADAVARCFTKDAVVEDEGHRHSGRAAIREVEERGRRRSTRTSASPSPSSRRTGIRRHEHG